MNATAARHLLSSVRAKAKSIVKMSTFRGTKDLFGGIIVRSSEEPQERNQMEQLLKGINFYLLFWQFIFICFMFFIIQSLSKSGLGQEFVESGLKLNQPALNGFQY